LLKQCVGNHHISLSTSHIQKITAQSAYDEIADEDDEDADDQSHQRFHGTVGHDPVVHNHGKTRCRQRKNIGQQSGHDDLKVNEFRGQ
jgi:hypothetical protein